MKNVWGYFLFGIIFLSGCATASMYTTYPRGNYTETLTMSGSDTQVAQGIKAALSAQGYDNLLYANYAQGVFSFSKKQPMALSMVSGPNLKRIMIQLFYAGEGETRVQLINATWAGFYTSEVTRDIMNVAEALRTEGAAAQ